MRTKQSQPPTPVQVLQHLGAPLPLLQPQGSLTPRTKSVISRAMSTKILTNHLPEAQKQVLKDRAHKLRKEGMTYTAIAKDLGVVISTVSLWLRAKSGKPVVRRAPAATPTLVTLRPDAITSADKLVVLMGAPHDVHKALELLARVNHV